MAQLRLDRVLVVPTGVPPHKEVDDDPGPEVRLELCRAATDDDDRLVVSRLELDRGGPSWSVDTLREIHAADPEDELTFIVGGDQARGLPSWREPEVVLDLASLAVAERAGVVRRDIAEGLTVLRGAPERVSFFAMPRLDVSSTDIRHRVREGRPIRYLVPAAVEARIREAGLYGPAASAALEEPS